MIRIPQASHVPIARSAWMEAAKHQTICAESTVPGTAGEMVQGQLPSGENFLITIPINIFSTVSVSIALARSGISVFPKDRGKSKRAAEATLKELTASEVGCEINVISDIPLGKGMASSTADIVATIEAIGLALNVQLSFEQISRIAIDIEPSDGIMYQGVVAYDHRAGSLLKTLGPTPPMRLLIIDSGPSIDTIEFNQKPKNFSMDEKIIYEELYQIALEGVQKCDLSLLGRASTKSAEMNQRLLHKEQLSSVQEIGDKTGAYGVICAHSGSILSLIYDIENEDGLKQAKEIVKTSLSQVTRVFSAMSVAKW